MTGLPRERTMRAAPPTTREAQRLEPTGGATSTPEWLVGGGEMGGLIRRTDWSKTPFGPREAWSASLRTAVSMVLGSQSPMALLWGSDLLLLYNDAYREIAEAKHPTALGRS